MSGRRRHKPVETLLCRRETLATPVAQLRRRLLQGRTARPAQREVVERFARRNSQRATSGSSPVGPHLTFRDCNGAPAQPGRYCKSDCASAPPCCKGESAPGAQGTRGLCKSVVEKPVR